LFAEEICAEHFFAVIHSQKYIPHKFLPQTMSSLKVCSFCLMSLILEVS